MADLCKSCEGRGVVWACEEEGKGTGDVYQSSNPKDPLNGTRFRRGWNELCKSCGGEGFAGKKPTPPVEFCVGKALSLHRPQMPTEFGPNTPENVAWKAGSKDREGHAGESVWLASNGMLLITHSKGWEQPCEIVTFEEISERTGPPLVKAKYYAWLNHGTFIGPYVQHLIDALEEYNRLYGKPPGKDPA